MPGGFPDKSSLQRALSEWCTNATEAQASYGYVSSWDVSAVTDTSRLLYDQGCTYRFDEDINGWDVAQVTNMQVSCAHVAVEGRARGLSHAYTR